MTQPIDKKVVEMAFENSQFEKGVSQSVDSINKLKKSLDFSGANKSFGEIDAAAKRVNLGHIADGVDSIAKRFSAMGIIGMTAIANLTNSAINAGSRIARALIIDPVKTGLAEYETKLNSIQTILANTQKEGTNIDIVTEKLDELNKYSDQTIYSFQEMARNIGTFTAAGVKLDDSVAAIKGIANLAAVSGSSSQQAATAMYQLSQALSSGTVRLMDWNSVVAAGMGGQVFQDAIKETARVHGVAIDQIIKEEGSFRDSLQRGWLSSEIMTETLAKFTGDLNAEQLKTMGYSEEQIASIIKLGQTANDAATKVKTFSQLFSTLKEAAQSGWAKTWELIIGNFEEARSFLTELNNWFGAILNSSADARNALLEGWRDLGGRTKMLEAFQNILNSIVAVIEPIRQAMTEIFPPTTAQQLLKITEGVLAFTKRLMISAEQAEKLKRVFRGVFAILDIGKEFILALARQLGRLLSAIAPVSGGLLDLLATIGDLAVKLRDTIKSSGVFEKVLSTIGDAILLIAGVITGAINAIVSGVRTFFDVKDDMGILDALTKGFQEFLSSFKGMDVKIVGGLIERIKERFSQLKSLKGFFKGGDSPEKEVNPFIEKLMKIRDNVLEAIKGFVLSLLDSLAKVDFSKIKFNSILDGINAGLLGTLLVAIVGFVKKGSGLFDGIVGVFKGVTSVITNGAGILASISGILDGVKGVLTAWQQQIRAGVLMKIATAIGILAISLIALSMIDSKKLTMALGAVTGLFANLFTTMAVYEKMQKPTAGVGGMAKAIVGFIGLASAVLILSAALVAVSKIPEGDIVRGIASIAAMSAMMVATATVLSRTSGVILRGMGSMVIFSIALLAMTIPLKKLSELDPASLGRGLIGLGVLLAEIGIFLKTLNVNSANLEDIIGLTLISAAISVLANVIKTLGDLDASTLTKGLSTIGVLLTGMGLFLRATSSGGAFILTATAMLIMSGALVVLSEALIRVGSMSMDQITNALIGLGGALLILAVALAAMNGSIVGSGALLIAAGALAILAPSLKLLGSMSLEQIGLSLLALAGGLTVLGIAGAAITPAIPGLLALAVVLAAIGVAALGVGVGVLAFSAGMAALAVTGAAGGAALAGILLTLSAILPLFAVGLAKAIVSFMKTLKELAPDIFDAGKALIVGFVRAVTETIPEIVIAMMEFLTKLVRAIADRTPELIQAGMDFIVGFLTGVRDNIGAVVTTSIEVVTAYMDAIASKIPEVVDSGWNFIIAWIDGMRSGVEDHLPELMNSVRELGLAIVKGLAQGILDGNVDGVEAIKELGAKVIQAFKEMLGIRSPSTVFFDLALQIIAGLVNGFKTSLSTVKMAVTQIGLEVINTMRGRAENMLTVGKDLVSGLVIGIREKISQAVLAAKELATAVLTSIKNTLGIQSPSKETMELGRYFDEGLAVGIAKFSGSATQAAEKVGEDAVAKLSGSLQSLSGLTDSNINLTPTIRPVVDLTDVETSSAKLTEMLSAPTLKLNGLTAKIPTIPTKSDLVTEPQPTTGTETPASSIQFVQNNYSPTPLDRLSLYRATNLQLQRLKALTGA